MYYYTREGDINISPTVNLLLCATVCLSTYLSLLTLTTVNVAEVAVLGTLDDCRKFA